MTAPTLADPEGLVRAPRPAAPYVVVRAALLTGAVAAALLTGPPGVGVPLAALAGGAALRPVVRQSHGSRPRAGYLAPALLLLCAAALRDAGWLVALDLLAAAALCSLALVPWRSWAGVLRGTAALGLVVPAATGWLLRGLRRAGRVRRWPDVAPALRGTVLAAGLLPVFVPLLASADAAFAALLDRLVPDLSGLDGLTRTELLVLGSVVTAAASRLLLSPPPEPRVTAATRRLTRSSEWLLPLGSLTALLATFVAVSAEAMFGGRDHVLSRTGLTYAEYVHSGFWQLLAATALVLAVVAAAVRWTPCGRGVRALLGALSLLALVIDASSLSRLSAYVDAFGLTRLRLLVGATCVWLALVLVAVLVPGLRRSGRLPAAVVLSAVAVLLALTAANPDERIARSAVERGGQADLAYLSSLSADAVPALLALPPATRACVLQAVAGRSTAASWTSANVSRSRARLLLARLPAAPCIDGPLPVR